MFEIEAVLITFISGLFFLISFILVSKLKLKKDISCLLSSMAFTVMVGMLFLDFLPEITDMSHELFSNNIYKITLIILFISIGVLILKVLDILIPHHHHDHHDKEKNIKEHNNHSFHVGFILALSIFLHNILEGMSLFIIAKENIASGITMAIGIGIHNLPLGIEIANGMLKENNKKINIITMLSLFISTSLGAMILFFTFFCFLSIACGMILYLTLFELLKEIIDYQKNKLTYVGIISGLLLLGIMTFLE